MDGGREVALDKNDHGYDTLWTVVPATSHLRAHIYASTSVAIPIKTVGGV